MPYLNNFFQLSIRESAAETLDVCLKLVEVRERGSKKQWHRKIYDEAYKGLSHPAVEIIHGSLLSFRVLFTQPGKLLEDTKYREAFEIIFRLRDHKDPSVRKSVVSIFPGFAYHETEVFVREYLNFTMDFLLNQSRKEKEKSACKSYSV